MSLRECIINGVKEGAITEAQGKEAEDLFDDFLTRSAGDEAAAARKTFDQLKHQAARRRHLNMLRVKTFKRLSTEMNNYKPAFKALMRDGLKVTTADVPRPGKYLQSLVDFEEGTGAFTKNLVGTYESVRSSAFAMFDEGLRQNRQALFGRKGKADSHDLLMEVFGKDSGKSTAKTVADQWRQVSEYLRLRANQAGMAIPKRIDWHLPQKHESVLVSSVSAKEWKKAIRKDLDVDKMINEQTGNKFTPEELELALSEVYETITMGGLNKMKEGVTGAGKALANRRQDHRFLVFETPEGWMRYQERFGDPDVFGTMMSHVETMSRDIAMLENLGPNPNTTIAALKIEAQKIARRHNVKNANTRATDMLGNDLKKYEAMADIFTGEGSIPANVTMANFGAGIRNLQTSALLGSVTPIAVPGDFNTSRLAAQMVGLPVTKLMSGLMEQISPLTIKERTQFGARLGIAAENWMSRSHAQARYFGEVVGGNKSIAVSDAVLRATGLSSWTQGARQAFGIEFLGHLADLKNKKFNTLPKSTRNTLEKYNITEDRWNIIRQTEMETHKGVDFVRPLNIEARTDLANNLGRDISVSLQSLIHNETNRAVPQATVRGRATLVGKPTRGTFTGELLESVAQFKSFPVSIMQGNMLRYLSMEGYASKARWTADFAISMAIAGALGLQARELLSGRDPLDMTTAKFWGQSIMTGGGLGIFGDFLFSDVNRYGGGLAETTGGPVLSVANMVRNLTIGNAVELAQGEKTNFARELIDFTARNLPGQNIWYARLALERIGIDQLRIWADDNSHNRFARLEGKRIRERNQESWWASGETSPRRGPDFGAALGQ